MRNVRSRTCLPPDISTCLTAQHRSALLIRPTGQKWFSTDAISTSPTMTCPSSWARAARERAPSQTSLSGSTPPTSGSIFINSLPAETLDVQWLRENVTLVQQSSTAFNGTLAMNVSLGARDPHQVTESRIRWACQQALLHLDTQQPSRRSRHPCRLPAATPKRRPASAACPRAIGAPEIASAHSGRDHQRTGPA